MNVPPKNNPRWQELVTGKKVFTLKFLAAKIFLGRIVRTVSAAPTPDNIRVAIDQLYDMFLKNEAASSVQEDLKTIFG